MTGIGIYPHTQIAHHFFIDHGTGTVVGGTAIIGNYVSLYQGVTLGAKSFPVDAKTGEKIKNLPRHPIIEDNVSIYANTVVLGRITIGKGSVIGANWSSRIYLLIPRWFRIPIGRLLLAKVYFNLKMDLEYKNKKTSVKSLHCLRSPLFFFYSSNIYLHLIISSHSYSHC